MTERRSGCEFGAFGSNLCPAAAIAAFPTFPDVAGGAVSGSFDQMTRKIDRMVGKLFRRFPPRPE